MLKWKSGCRRKEKKGKSHYFLKTGEKGMWVVHLTRWYTLVQVSRNWPKTYVRLSSTLIQGPRRQNWSTFVSKRSFPEIVADNYVGRLMLAELMTG